jgi:hypothetical protein
VLQNASGPQSASTLQSAGMQRPTGYSQKQISSEPQSASLTHPGMQLGKGPLKTDCGQQWPYGKSAHSASEQLAEGSAGRGNDDVHVPAVSR